MLLLIDCQSYDKTVEYHNMHIKHSVEALSIAMQSRQSRAQISLG